MLSLPHFAKVFNMPADASFRRWLLFAFLLTLVWALALTISQHFSIPAEENHRMKDLLGRFFFSFFLLMPLVLLLPRLAILGMLIISLFFQWGTMYYCSYFGSAPEIMMLWNNGSEGTAVSDAIWATIPWHCLLFLVPVLIIQIVLLYCQAPPRSFYFQRLNGALCCLILYGMLFWQLNSWSPTRGFNHATSSNSDRCAKFGFLPAFARDLVIRYVYVDALNIQALKNESRRSFGLQSEYGEFSFGDVVVVQVESLDNAVIDYCVGDKPVVPFLNSLQKNSLLYRIWANHRYASATADFEMLNGIPPLDGVFNYQIPDMPYNTSLPRFFGEQGYETFCFHGVRGSFFNRLPAFMAMGFDHLIFRDDIVKAVKEGKYPIQDEFSEAQLKQYLNDAWLRDNVVFKAALREIQSPSERKRFFFVITVTSHNPYRTGHIEEADKLIPNEMSMNDRYLNSIHTVDGWLRSFFEGLPHGTLLVIYGDHTPGFRGGTYVSDTEGNREFVPCFLHVVGEDLQAFQKVPRRSHDTTLSVRDVHSFLRDVTEYQSRLTTTPAELATPAVLSPLR